jgi:hypothetical protein
MVKSSPVTSRSTRVTINPAADASARMNVSPNNP